MGETAKSLLERIYDEKHLTEKEIKDLITTPKVLPLLDIVYRSQIDGKVLVRLTDLRSYNANNKGEAERQLYEILEERLEDDVNISHTKMPTWEQHIDFMDSNPYMKWHVILDEKNNFLGHIYISHNNELGIFLFKIHQGKHYGQMAVSFYLTLFKHLIKYVNINPNNERSIKFFDKLGFKHIQNTYKLS